MKFLKKTLALLACLSVSVSLAGCDLGLSSVSDSGDGSSEQGGTSEKQTLDEYFAGAQSGTLTFTYVEDNKDYVLYQQIDGETGDVLSSSIEEDSSVVTSNVTVEFSLTDLGMDMHVTSEQAIGDEQVSSAEAYIIDGICYRYDEENKVYHSFEASFSSALEALGVPAEFVEYMQGKTLELLQELDLTPVKLLAAIGKVFGPDIPQTELGPEEFSYQLNESQLAIFNMLLSQTTAKVDGETTLREIVDFALNKIAESISGGAPETVSEEQSGEETIEETSLSAQILAKVGTLGEVNVAEAVAVLDENLKNNYGVGLQDAIDLLAQNSILQQLLVSAGVPANVVEQIAAIEDVHAYVAANTTTVDALIQTLSGDETITVAGAVDIANAYLDSTLAKLGFSDELETLHNLKLGGLGASLQAHYAEDEKTIQNVAFSANIDVETVLVFSEVTENGAPARRDVWHKVTASVNAALSEEPSVIALPEGAMTQPLN